MINVEYKKQDLRNIATFLVGARVVNLDVPQEQKLLPAPVEVNDIQVRSNVNPEWMVDPRALKVEAYKTKEEFVTEVTRIILENRKGTEEERISPYQLCFDKDGNPKFRYENKSVLGKAEYEGMMNIRELALNGNKYMVWFSLPRGRSRYTEGRIVVGCVEKTDGEVIINCRGIPILENAERMKQLAAKFMKMGAVQIGECHEAEDLREQPVGINCNNDREFWDQCEEVFGLDEVWNAIRFGKDIKVKDTIESWVGDIWDELQEKRKNGEIITRADSIKWGKWVEDNIRARGIVMVGGNHGAMNGEIGMTAFSGIFMGSEMGLQLENKNGKWVCPCGQEISEGTTVCPKCGLKLFLN